MLVFSQRMLDSKKSYWCGLFDAAMLRMTRLGLAFLSQVIQFMRCNGEVRATW